MDWGKPTTGGVDGVATHHAGTSAGGANAAGGGGGRWAALRGRVARGLSQRPSMLDRSRPFFTGVHRFGVARFALFLSDPFHTLLNLPWWKFVLVFFSTYLAEFCAFALLYWLMPRGCMVGVDGSFAHALWMSSRTASTLGFTSIYPNPDCAAPNLVVMLQVICASLLNMVMLGIVFARFSAPFKRAEGIRFSAVATVGRHRASGFWAITVR